MDPKDTIAGAIDGAAPAPRSKTPPADERQRQESSQRRRAENSDRDTPYDLSFPEDSPVEPLGMNETMFYFLDQKRQLIGLKANELNQGGIIALYGEMQELLFTYWPRYGKPDPETGDFKIIGWRPEVARQCLVAEAARRGVIDVVDRVRGPGSWLGEDGKLIMHCGDLLFFGERALTPRREGRHVYPSAPEMQRPDFSTDGKAEAEELLALLRSWNWRRPALDPVLLLGWIVNAMMGGATDWRALAWITGDKATGKSTLHKVINGVFGPGGLIASTDPTAAGLRQSVGHASLPVALDEIEAEEDNRKVRDIIKLARHAASGGKTIRGGSDHKASSFTVRNCFLFSSVLIPPMMPQDVSRMAILELDDLPAGSRTPRLEPARLAQIGAALRGRIIREFKRLPDLLEAWQAELADAGHTGRGRDQFGTLMACYDLIMHDGYADGEQLKEWAKLLGRDVLAETSGDDADHQRCIGYLLTKQVDFFRAGERRTVGTWLQMAAGTHPDGDDKDKREAQRCLQNIGILYQEKPVNGKPVKLVHFANDHQGLADLFRESHWRAESGTNGVWTQALRRVPGAVADQQRFTGVKKRCTCVPLESIFGGGDE